MPSSYDVLLAEEKAHAESAARIEVLEQGVRMLMRELAQRRGDVWDRQLEATLAQARRVLHGEPMP